MPHEPSNREQQEEGLVRLADAAAAIDVECGDALQELLSGSALWLLPIGSSHAPGSYRARMVRLT
jgi:hypothetical protein